MADQVLQSYSNINEDGDIKPDKMFPEFPKIITDTFSTKKQINFHRQFYDSGQYKDYFYQMFLGLFFSIGGDPGAMDTMKDAYFRSIDDNLRLFAVHNSGAESEAMVHMHSIFMGKMAMKPSEAGAYTADVAKDAHFVSNFHLLARTITKEEYQSLKERLQTDHRIDLDKADLRLYEYEAVPTAKPNDKMTIKMNLLPNYIEETSHDPNKRTEFVDRLRNEPFSTLDEASVNLFKLPKTHDGSGHIDYFHEFKNNQFFMNQDFSKFVEKSFDLYKAEESAHSGNRIAPLLDSPNAMGGFLHGLLLGSNHIQHFKGPVMKYIPNGENNGLLTMQIRDINTLNPDQYLMVDFSTNDARQNVGYDFLREIYRSQVSGVTYLRPMYDKTVDEVKVNERLLKWNVPNMLDNLLDQVKILKEEEVPVDIVQLAKKYFRHINNILKPYMDNAQTGLSIEQFKFYLLGIFKAHQESLVTIEAGQQIGSEAAKDTSSLDSFLLHFDRSKENGVMLNLKPVDGSQNANSRLADELGVSEADRKLVVDVSMKSNGRGLVFKTRYAKNSEIAEQYHFRTLESVELLKLYQSYFRNVDGMLNYGDMNRGRRISNQFKSTFGELLQETKEFKMGQQAMSSFIDGAFSHFDDKKVYESFSSDRCSKLVQLSSDYGGVSNILQIDIKLTDDHSVDPVELATVQSHSFNNEDMVPINTFTIAYNRAKLENNLAIAAADKRLNNFNTENVNEFCSTISGRRRKRFAGKPCSFLEKEIGEIVDPKQSKLIDFEEISTSLKTHPELIGFEKHIKGVFELSGKVQLGFIGRDMIGDALRGDLKALGRDSLFFGGSILANKAGEKLAQAGIDMADAGLKIAGHALTSVGKCLPKLGFDIYMGYQLAQQIKHNDTTGAAITGTFIGIDLLECGLEALAAFGVITVVPVVGQVLLVASTLLLLAVNIYDSIKKVQQIDELVPLSFKETDRELFRAFFHLDSEPLISHLMDEVQANEVIMNRVLDANSDIKRFIVASGILTEQVDDQPRSIEFLSKNKINMQSKRKIAKISRALPRKKTLINATLFCQMDENDENAEIEESFLDEAEDFLADTWSGSAGGIMSSSFYRLTTGTSKNKWEDVANLIPIYAIYKSIDNLFVPNETPKEIPIEDYVCMNAFGVERNGVSATDDTLFILHDGDDSAVGLKDSPNTFILGDGIKRIIGGDQNDKFVIYGNFTEGVLNGAGGYNTLDMSSFNADSQLIILNNLIYYDDFFPTTSGNPEDEAWIKMKNIQEIIGRNGTADSMTICNQRAVNLQGGQSWRSSDMIFVKDCGLPVNVTIALNNFTNVYNTADDANVTYIIDPFKTDAFIMLNRNTTKNQNKFVFSSIKLLDIKIKYYPSIKGLIFNYNNRKILSVVQKNENATFLFADGATVQLRNGQLVATLSNERSLMDLIDQYDDYAEENANMTIIAHTHTENETVILGSRHITIRDGDQEKEINVIRNSFNHALNLYGRRKIENYFLITVTKECFESLEDFKLPEIKIHSHATKNFPDYIDLHMMAVQLHTLGDYDLNVELANNTNGKGVFLILSARARSNGDLVSSIGRIRIINGQKKFKHLTVFIYNENRIKNNGTDLVLEPTAVPINEKIITITPGQIDPHTLLRFNYTVDKAQFYHMGKSLIISNVAHINELPADKLFTILFTDYFENEFKFNTIELQFKNHRIKMKDMKVSAWLSASVRSMWAHIAAKLTEIQVKPKHD